MAVTKTMAELTFFAYLTENVINLVSETNDLQLITTHVSQHIKAASNFFFSRHFRFAPKQFHERMNFNLISTTDKF